VTAEQRIKKYAEALNEGLAQAMAEDSRVYVMGLGVPAPTGIFGTTSGLLERFGPQRVMDMPSSEAAITGIGLGTTVMGDRPVIVHMRVDFAILALDQMFNQVAKWHFMYGGKLRAPMVFRVIVGRGWGQGPQHSQSLQAMFAHVPGLKVVMPSTPYDAKGMTIAAVRDDAPVVIVEHRWLYGIEGHVPETAYEVSLDSARLVRQGSDVTVAATSYMVLEAQRAAEILAPLGVSVEVVDVRSLTPIDVETLSRSAAKTGTLIVADTAHANFGCSAEIVASVLESGVALKNPPRRIALPWSPTPTSPSLSEAFYPRAPQIVDAIVRMLNLDPKLVPPEPPIPSRWHDVPDPTFKGPY